MLIVAIALYFLPTIVAVSRGHLSGLAIFLLDLFFGWTLIGWLAALIWSCTGNTAANLVRVEAGAMGPRQLAPPRSSSGSLWLVLIVVLIALAVFGKRHEFVDVRPFDLSFPSHDGFRL